MRPVGQKGWLVFDSKPFFQKPLRPATRALARVGVTANQVTLTTIVLSIPAGTLLWSWPDARWPLLLIPFVLLVRLACNHIDGMLAREHEMQSHVGAILNELADVVSDAALYLPFAAVPGVSPWLVVLVVVLAVISEMTGVVATQIGADRRGDGPMAKKPRGVVFGAIALALGVGATPGVWVDSVLSATLVLQFLTIGNRIGKALKQVA